MIQNLIIFFIKNQSSDVTKPFIKKGKTFPLKKGKECLFFYIAEKRLFSIRLFYERKRLVGQSLSTLCSTSLQHLSACGRSHSLAEAVYFTSLSLFGLIGSLHDLSPILVFNIFFLYFFCVIAVHPTITSPLYLNFPFPVKQFFPLFFVFS